MNFHQMERGFHLHNLVLLNLIMMLDDIRSHFWNNEIKLESES